MTSRRIVGTAVCWAPIALALASLVAGWRGVERGPSAVLITLALALAVYNLWCSAGRYAFHRLRGGTRDSYVPVSGLPGVGSLLVVAATLFAFGNRTTAALALLAIAIDTGGSFWFFVVSLRDPSFWDRARIR